VAEAVPGADAAALDGGGTGGLSWGVPDDGSGFLIMSASHSNRGQAGRLEGGGAGLHTHGLSGARSSSPDELGWPRRQWTCCSPAQFGKSDVRLETAINDLSYRREGPPNHTSACGMGCLSNPPNHIGVAAWACLSNPSMLSRMRKA
jgi:hypothetical protein